MNLSEEDLKMLIESMGHVLTVRQSTVFPPMYSAEEAAAFYAQNKKIAELYTRIRQEALKPISSVPQEPLYKARQICTHCAGEGRDTDEMRPCRLEGAAGLGYAGDWHKFSGAEELKKFLADQAPGDTFEVRVLPKST